jgi:T5SS/PEP-CTERM-associated repeat protein
MTRFCKPLRYGFPVFALALVGVASANTDVWLPSTDGNFNDPTKWSTGVPGAGDTAIFNRTGATYTVLFPDQLIINGAQNYVSSQLSVSTNTVTFAPSSSRFVPLATYTVTSMLLGAPPATPSVLSTSLHSLSTTTASIGFGSGSPGRLNVIGGTFSVTGSTAGDELIVGDAGSGSVVNVSGGAQMTVSGAEGNTVIGSGVGIVGTVNVSGAGSSWSNASNDSTAPLAIGGSGTGTLNISTGGHADDFDADVGRDTGSTGTVFVDGVGSNWTNRGTLFVGNSGLGSLTVSNGGQVNDNFSVIGAMPGGTGTATVTGAGAKWTQAMDLRLGSNFTFNGAVGNGSLHVSAGGQIATTGDAIVGTNGNGTVRLEDSGSKWTIGGALSVDSASRVDILAGAVVTSNTALNRGTVSVDEVGASWDVSDTLSVTTGAVLGPSTPATVNVGDGAHVSSRVAFVGTGSGSGQAFVDSAGSTWTTAEQLDVGISGGGQFNVTGGGHVNSGAVQLGVLLHDVGNVNVDASTWTNTGNFDVGVAGTATLTVSNGGTVSSGDTISVGPRGSLHGNSHFAANVRNGGKVAPGLNPAIIQSTMMATLNVDGDYTQTGAGALDIQLASAASLDELAISGRATLNGTLDISLFNGFTPTVGQSFDLLTASGGITGQFTSLNLPSLLSGGHGPFWTIVYTATDVILKLINSPIGDYNHNGVVDAADYTVWRDTLGKTGINLAADGDGDNVVTQLDYGIWKTNFGHIAGSGARSSAAVPEPRSLCLLAIGLIAMGFLHVLYFLARCRNRLANNNC